MRHQEIPERAEVKNVGGEQLASGGPIGFGEALHGGLGGVFGGGPAKTPKVCVDQRAPAAGAAAAKLGSPVGYQKKQEKEEESETDFEDGEDD